MRIIHIAPNASYNEGWSYQENILPKYQAKLGHDVILIVANQEHDKGMLKETACTDGVTKDGFRVIRMKQQTLKPNVFRNSLIRLDVYDILAKEKPDFIFYHGLISATILRPLRHWVWKGL